MDDEQKLKPIRGVERGQRVRATSCDGLHRAQRRALTPQHRRAPLLAAGALETAIKGISLQGIY